MDMLTNPNVRNGFLSLTELLDSMGFKFGTYVWDSRYKGLDDYACEIKTAFDMDMMTNHNIRNGFLNFMSPLDSMDFKF